MDHHSIRKIFEKRDIQQAWALIERAEKITLLTHYKPDGDGICACTALSLLLEKHGKKTETIYPTPPELEIKRQPKNVLINKHTFIPDVVIACDTANYDRLYFPDAFKNVPLINIDHHVSNTITGALNFVSGELASTCEQIFHLVIAWDPEALNREMAQALLYGLLYDSQVFHTKAANADTLRIAAALIDHGADLFAIKNELLQNKHPNIVALWGHVLSSISFSETKKSAWAVISQEDLKKRNLTLTSLVGFSNFLAQISGTDVTALFYEEQDGQTKVSLRSKQTDVNKLANQFGGGGHANASGISMNESLDVVVKKVSTEFE